MWVGERGSRGGGGFFVESDSYAIAFLLHSCEAVGRGNSMGLILEARSPLSFSFFGSIAYAKRSYLMY